jgi:hypothetical protein
MRRLLRIVGMHPLMAGCSPGLPFNRTFIAPVFTLLMQSTFKPDCSRKLLITAPLMMLCVHRKSGCWILPLRTTTLSELQPFADKTCTTVFSQRSKLTIDGSPRSIMKLASDKCATQTQCRCLNHGRGRSQDVHVRNTSPTGRLFGSALEIA